MTYAHGPVLVCGNSGNFWEYNTDDVLRITGVSYTGDTLASTDSPVDLSAQVAFDGSADGSGIEVTFTVGGSDYPATTVTGGAASTTAWLPAGDHPVVVTVKPCTCCEFTDHAALHVDTPPVAEDQSVATNAGAALAITLKATDADDDAVTYTVTGGPTHGALSGTAPELTYTPNPQATTDRTASPSWPRTATSTPTRPR